MSTHDRRTAHSGFEVDTDVVLASTIGPYAAGTGVRDVLLDMVARVAALESGNHRVASFTADALLAKGIQLNAVIRKGGTGSFTVDAYLTRGGSFTANAVIVSRRKFTIAAYIVLR